MVHTHSTFATAWAVVGKPIPVVLTAICDEFGGPIPVGAYAMIGGDEIGPEIIRSISSSPAILMNIHGVFTIGKTPLEAVKVAVIVEDVARTVFYATQLGQPNKIPAEKGVACPSPLSRGVWPVSGLPGHRVGLGINFFGILL